MILGLVLGTYFLPTTHQVYLQLFKTWVFPVIELSIATIVILKVRALLWSYKKQKDEALDFFTAVKNACAELLPQKIVIPMTTEIAIFYYGFVHWKSIAIKENEFTYHKRSGTPALLGAFIFIIAIETFSTHLIIGLWSETVAWILTALSFYTVIQVFGFLRSLAKRPIVLLEDRIIIRYGILSEVIIPLEDIETIELSRKRIKEEDEIEKLSPLGDFENHNVIIHLNKENTLTGLYGGTKWFKHLAMHVDAKEIFKTKIEAKLNY